MDSPLSPPWLARLEVVLIGLAGVVWFLGAGAPVWWPAPLVATAVFLRIRRGLPALSFLWLPVLLLLLTAVVGVWAAYDRPTAVAKLLILLTALLLFLALADYPRPDLWWLMGLLTAVAGLLAAIFLLTHTWQQFPADVAALTRFWHWWAARRPFLPLPPFHPNRLAGLLAILLPLMLALALYGWRARRWAVTGGTAVVTLFVFVVFSLTSSRAAWLAWAVGLGVWLAWVAARRWRPRPLPLFTVLLLGGGLVGLAALWASGGVVRLLHLPGADTSGSRLALAQDALRLAADFPFTGGGLAAFGGLYSQYILMTPHFFYDYAHNFYLDVLLEQTAVGLLALLLLFGGAGWRLLRAEPAPDLPAAETLRGALLAAFAVALLHGLVDDALYGFQGTPFLLLLPGLALAWGGPLAWRVDRIGRWPVLAGAMALLLALFLGRTALAARWLANLGAVQMAQVELADWPQNRWVDGRRLAPALHTAEETLAQALALDPHNPTAQHRLGLLALERWEFDTAVPFLQAAYQLDPGHRGVRKALGYSYLWRGDVDSAAPLLATLPETPRELVAYETWWRQNGRADLSALTHQLP